MGEFFKILRSRSFAVKYIILITKGVIRDQSSRRMVMFVIVLAALVMLFAGVTFLGGWLAENPVIFLVYWAACGWMTFAAILLALFDLIVVRAQERRERQRLKEEIFGKKEK